MGQLLQILSEAQSPSGAFRSVVKMRNRSDEDWNSFTTAQVLRTLNGMPVNGELATIREQALDFLLRCESTTQPGAFGFWPKGKQPPWIHSLPEDADDTAIIAIELARSGRLDHLALRRIACNVLLPQRLRHVEQPAPPWLIPGAFRTWLRRDPCPNPVDCCVNANVVGLLAFAELKHLPGYRQACAMIEAGLCWAGGSWARACALTPFYPHPIELFYAVAHAVACGAEALNPSLELLQKLWWIREDSGNAFYERPICGSAYGNTTWKSHALQKVRKFLVPQKMAICRKSP